MSTYSIMQYHTTEHHNMNAAHTVTLNITSKIPILENRQALPELPNKLFSLNAKKKRGYFTVCVLQIEEEKYIKIEIILFNGSCGGTLTFSITEFQNFIH
jgi:hypothetical protein